MKGKIKITESGLLALNEKITNQEQLVKDIQAEKVIAYTASGDGWHDNPGFNALEQKEFAACEDLGRLLKIRDTATVVKIEPRNTEAIQIGSISRMEQVNLKDNSIKQLTWEIAGHLESDIRAGKISYDSPIAAAILGKKVGEECEVTLPMGKVRFKILALYDSWEKAKQ